MTPSGRTRLIALLGDPVSHSLSPRIQNAAFRAAGVDGVYLALRSDAAALGGLLSGIARAGGGGNVTLPHKELAASHLERSTAAVRRTGACNTFWMRGGELWGDNTDVRGFSVAAEQLLGAPPRGARVLLLGAGGAARAVLSALLDGGAAEVTVCNRTARRAAEMIARCAPGDARVRSGGIGVERERWDLVVNATRLGLRPGDEPPLALERGDGIGAVLDLVYAPGETAWVRCARALGIPAADGLPMLIAQGAAAFERWWDRPAPTEAMRAAAGV